MRKILKLCLLSLALLSLKAGNDSYSLKEVSGFQTLKIKEMKKVKVRDRPTFLLRGEDVYYKYESGERISIRIPAFLTGPEHQYDNRNTLEKLMEARGIYNEKLEVDIYSDVQGVLGREERAVTYRIIDSYKIKHFVTIFLEFFDPYGPIIYLNGVEPLYGMRTQIYVSSDAYLTGQDIKNQFICYDPYDRDYHGMEDSYLEIIKDEYHENNNWQYPGEYEVLVKATDLAGNQNTFDLSINVCSLKEGEYLFGNHALIVTPSSKVRSEDILREIFKTASPFYDNYHSSGGEYSFDKYPIGYSPFNFSAYKNGELNIMPMNLYVFEPVDKIPSRPKDDEGNPFVEDKIIRYGQKEEIKEKKQEKSIFTQITEFFSTLFNWMQKIFIK